MEQNKLIVVALGGNAITQPEGPQDIPAQFQQTMKTAACIADLIEAGYRIVVTHGNGPQVGFILRRVELAASELHTIPLELCVADSQGGMGYMITQCLTNEFLKRNIHKNVACVITTVVVDRDDPDFSNPTKPIGSHYTESQAKKYETQEGWLMKEVLKGKFRRVVPSPLPLHILEQQAIEKLIAEEQVVVACGGGGIPVVQNADGSYQGVAAVVDKDRASALLAKEIEADILLILTAVEKVYLNYNTPQQTALDILTIKQAQRYLDDGQFPPGSMRPKIEAAMDFVSHHPAQSAHAIITAPEHARAALQGTTGTHLAK